MTAIAAAEKMDRQYRFQRHIYDATRTHYLLWRRRLIKELAPPRGGSVVEIACGTGWNLVRAARRYPQARFYGLDISAEMLRTATAAIQKNGLRDRVKLAQGDATNFDLQATFELAGADRIFISYALSMIPDWPSAIESAVRALNPGGALYIVDFGRMERLPHAPRWAFRRFLKHYNVTPRHDLERVAREAAGRHGMQIRFEESRRGYSAYAVLTKD
ncbi:MAG: methyltransferase domain-containing protein [Hyphomicrobium sp.]|jgi:S-adenosylmethionine-diacylgycerolhomoserine-N-methlytransferase|nr:methyltransferase domain-containing protein [Hyphomicrobium sp.]